MLKNLNQNQFLFKYRNHSIVIQWYKTRVSDLYPLIFLLKWGWNFHFFDIFFAFLNFAYNYKFIFQIIFFNLSNFIIYFLYIFLVCHRMVKKYRSEMILVLFFVFYLFWENGMENHHFLNYTFCTKWFHNKPNDFT